MDYFRSIRSAFGASPSPTIVSEFPDSQSDSPSSEKSASMQAEHIARSSDSTTVDGAVARGQMMEKSASKYEEVPTFSSSGYHPDVTLKLDVKESAPLLDDDDEESRVERHEAKKSNCLALINLEAEKDPAILNNEEKQKLTFITSYIKQIGVHEASKLHDLELTIQDASSKASNQEDAFSFKKSLLNSFLIPKYDLPGDINQIDAENARLLETSAELHPEAISSASEEFKDPYLQGNQANYSKEFLFVQSRDIGQVLLPSRGKFQGGIPLREECEHRAKSTILECFQKKGIGHAYPSELKPPHPIAASKESQEAIDTEKIQQEKLIYSELLADVGRSYMVLQDKEKVVVISSSQNDNVSSVVPETPQQSGSIAVRVDLVPAVPKKVTAPKEEALTQFKKFVGDDHRPLGVAIGRMMNQTIMADVDAMRKLKTLEPGSLAQQQLQYPDKGLLYFQYIPHTGRKQETVSHALTKESEKSFKISSTLYQEGLLSSEHGEKDLLLQMNAQVSYQFSESSAYDSTKEMTLENLPCHVKCLDLTTDYQIRETE